MGTWASRVGYEQARPALELARIRSSNLSPLRGCRLLIRGSLHLSMKAACSALVIDNGGCKFSAAGIS